MARRLTGFDCRIIVTDPYMTAQAAQKDSVILASLEDMLPQADFVSLHVPFTDETREMVDEQFLARMKPGAFLINTSRGELIQEDALVEALKNGCLRGAALDVFTKEPPGPDHPLLALPQVMTTPHCAAHTDASIRNMGQMAVSECLAVLRGEQPRYQVKL